MKKGYGREFLIFVAMHIRQNDVEYDKVEWKYLNFGIPSEDAEDSKGSIYAACDDGKWKRLKILFSIFPMRGKG